MNSEQLMHLMDAVELVEKFIKESYELRPDIPAPLLRPAEIPRHLRTMIEYSRIIK